MVGPSKTGQGREERVVELMGELGAIAVDLAAVALAVRRNIALGRITIGIQGDRPSRDVSALHVPR